MKLCVDFRRWQLDAKHSCRAGGITGILPQSLQICAVQILVPYTLLPFTDEGFFTCPFEILISDFIECLFYETLNAFLAFRQVFMFPLSVIQGPETCLFWTTSAGSLAVEGCAKKGRLLICDFCLNIKSNATCTKTSQVSWRKEKCFKWFMSVSDCWDSETALLLIDAKSFVSYHHNLDIDGTVIRPFPTILGWFYS